MKEERRCVGCGTGEHTTLDLNEILMPQETRMRTTAHARKALFS